MKKEKIRGSANSSGGVGFLGLLTIVFIVLKLTEVIAWSWLWVLAPLWFPTAIGLVVLLFAGLMFLISSLIK